MLAANRSSSTVTVAKSPNFSNVTSFGENEKACEVLDEGIEAVGAGLTLRFGVASKAGEGVFVNGVGVDIFSVDAHAIATKPEKATTVMNAKFFQDMP